MVFVVCDAILADHASPLIWAERPPICVPGKPRLMDWWRILGMETTHGLLVLQPAGKPALVRRTYRQCTEVALWVQPQDGTDNLPSATSPTPDGSDKSVAWHTCGLSSLLYPMSPSYNELNSSTGNVIRLVAQPDVTRGTDELNSSARHVIHPVVYPDVIPS
jgi:hypothetical protein